MASINYNTFGRAIAKNDMDTVTVKVMLMDPAYVPDRDAHVYVSDISASRASGTTDLTLGTFAINIDNTDNRTEFDWADFVTGAITAAGGTNAAVPYISTGVDATSELLTYNELTLVGVQTTFYPVGGTLTGTISANGLFSI